MKVFLNIEKFPVLLMNCPWSREQKWYRESATLLLTSRRTRIAIFWFTHRFHNRSHWLHQPQRQWLSCRLLFRCERSTRLDVSCLLVRHLTIRFFFVALLLSVFRSPLTICLSLHSCLSIPLCTALLMKVVLGSNKKAAFQLGDLFLACHCFRDDSYRF